MGIDARIYIPGNARVKDVTAVIGKLLSLSAIRTSVTENPPGFVRVPSATTRAAKEQPECVVMEFVGIPDPARAWGDERAYLLYQFESTHGGDRVIVARSNAFNLAIFKGLADFFGGGVLYSDCGDMGIDYSVPAKCDELNQPEDGKPYWDLQQRIFDLKPLTNADFKAANEHAAYRE